MDENKKILNTHLDFTKERNWDQFQTPKNLCMALSAEAAELLEVFMWLTDTQSRSIKKAKLREAEEEIADVFIYLLRIAHELDINLIKAAEKKMKRNVQKYPIEKGLDMAKLYEEC
jgi:NTP pyrophosphatase (non-canonical NTP hydrolase)